MNGYRAELIVEVVEDGSMVETYEVTAPDRASALEVARKVARARWPALMTSGKAWRVEIRSGPFGIRSKFNPSDCDDIEVRRVGHGGPPVDDKLRAHILGGMSDDDLEYVRGGGTQMFDLGPGLFVGRDEFATIKLRKKGAG